MTVCLIASARLKNNNKNNKNDNNDSNFIFSLEPRHNKYSRVKILSFDNTLGRTLKFLDLKL